MFVIMNFPLELFSSREISYISSFSEHPVLQIYVW